jgi:hypothetical protein
VTRQEALAVWAILAASSSGRELTEAELEVRAELVADLDFAAARRAAIAYAQEAQWLPSVAELRAAVLAPDVPEAAGAWSEVCEYVARHGWPAPPDETSFSHPAVFEALRGLGNWQDFCGGDGAVNRAHFLRVYPAVRERARRDELVAPAYRPALGAAAGPALGAAG